MAETLPTPLQESILTLLAFDDKHGSLVAVQVTPDHFDEPYQEIAKRILQYRQTYSRPPGFAHLDDIFADLIKHKSSERMSLTKSILLDMGQTAPSLNPQYLSDRVALFIRQQHVGNALVQATERFMAGGDDVLEQTEEIMLKALAFRAETMSAGLFFTDWKQGLHILSEPREFYRLGIPQFDRRGIGPSPGEVLLYIAPKGSGKSWFCHHVGKMALLQRARVAHISLENKDKICYIRYCQTFFGIAQFPERYVRAKIEKEDDSYSGYDSSWVTPKLYLQHPDLEKVVQEKVEEFENTVGGLVIKKFPTKGLTVPQLEAYLDYLERVHKFIPNILIVDYPDKMKTDPNNYRHSLGDIFSSLCGLAARRNVAVVAPSQGGRKSITASVVRSDMAAEDIRKVDDADLVLAYSQTQPEKTMGLARLSVEHGRDVPDKFTVMISQTYETGQYALDSAYVNDRYWADIQAPNEEETEDGERRPEFRPRRRLRNA